MLARFKEKLNAAPPVPPTPPAAESKSGEVEAETLKEKGNKLLGDKVLLRVNVHTRKSLMC